MSDTIKTTISKGTKLLLDEQEIVIGDILGEGLTGMVFRCQIGENQAAIKVLKSGTNETIKRHFIGEAITIKNIFQNWQELWPQDLPVVPKIYGVSNEDNQNYLVMEFIAGKEIPSVLKSNGPLSEFDAISLANQFGKLLCVLHEKLEKCYADIKFENLWLLDERQSEKSPLLKVTDWNVLGDHTEDGVHRDLFYASLYLYRMLTGVTLPFGGVQLHGRIDQDELFHPLSVGVQQFLQTALHPNLSRRFSSSREWVNELEKLVRWWAKSADEVNMEAAEALESAQTKLQQKEIEDSAVEYNRAQVLLDISDRLGRGNREMWVFFSKKVQEGLDSTDNLDIGLRHLQGGGFKEAEAVFLKAGDFSPLGAEKFYRWYWLANASKEIGLEAFNNCSSDLIEGTEALIAENALLAETKYDSAIKSLHSIPAGLDALRNEAKILLLVDKAHQAQMLGDYHASMLQYKEASELFDGLPTSPKTNWTESAGDLKALYHDAINEEQRFGFVFTELENAKKAVSENNWNEVASHIKAAWYKVPDAPQTFNFWYKLAAEKISNTEFSIAQTILEPAFSTTGNVKQLIYLSQQANDLQMIGTLANKKKLDIAIDYANSYLEKYFNRDPFFPDVFKRQVDLIFNYVLSEDQLQIIDDIVKLMNKVDPVWAKQAQTHALNTTRDWKQFRIERLIKECDEYIDQENLAEADNKLEELLKSLDETEPNWQKYSQKRKIILLKISENRKKYEERLKKISAEIVMVRSEYKERVDLFEKIRSSKALPVMEIYTEADHTQKSFALLSRGLVLVKEWLRLVPSDPDGREQEKWFENQINLGNQEAWNSVYQQSKKFLSYLDQSFLEAQNMYDAGKLEESIDISDQIKQYYESDKNFAILQAKIEKTGRFKVWASGLNQNRQDDDTKISGGVDADIPALKNWVSEGIPEIYWEKFLGSHFTDKFELAKNVFQQTPLEQQKKFSNALLDLMQYTWAMMNIDTACGKEFPIDKTTLEEIIGTAKDITRKGKSKQKIAELLTVIRGMKSQNMPTSQEMSDAFDKVENQENKRKNIISISGIVLGVIALASVIFFGFRQGWFNTILAPEPRVTVEAVPTATYTLAPPTETMIPTNTATSTSTPIPASVFLMELNEITWDAALPEQIHGPVYIMDDKNAVFIMPPENSEIFDTSEIAYNGSMRSISSESEVNVVWEMDQPMPVSGWHEIFVSDPGDKAGSDNIELPYIVKIDNIETSPIIGSSTIKQWTNATHPEAKNSWRSIGIYEVLENQKVSVSLIMPSYAGDASNILGIDAVMIAPVPHVSQDRNLNGKQILFLTDSSDVTFTQDKTLWQCSSENEVGTANWGPLCKFDLGTYFTDSTKTDSVVATWKLYPLSGPGQYDVYVSLLDFGDLEQATMEYKIYKNGRPYNDKTPFSYEKGEGLAGTEHRLGVVELAKDERATISVEMQTKDKTGWVIVDAAYLTRHEEEPASVEAPTETTGTPETVTTE